jgi:hypothetical protein
VKQSIVVVEIEVEGLLQNAHSIVEVDVGQKMQPKKVVKVVDEGKTLHFEEKDIDTIEVLVKGHDTYVVGDENTNTFPKTGEKWIWEGCSNMCCLS